MKGNVLGFDPDTNTGAISGYDGQRYDFVTAEWRGAGRPRRGDVVDFQAIDQRATEIYLVERDLCAAGFLAVLFFAERAHFALAILAQVLATLSW